MASPLLEAGILFVAAAIANAAANRVGLSAVPVYILAGIGLNEFVAGRLAAVLPVPVPTVSVTEFVAVGAELGIVFLLFYLGIEFSLDRLLSEGDRILTAGAIDLIVNFGIGLLVGLLLFDSLLAAVIVAGVVYPSSSAIITRSLLELGWIANEESGPILGVLVFEDLVLAVYLVVVPTVLLSGRSPATAVVPVGLALGFVALLAIGVRVATGPLERLLDTQSSEAVTLRALGLLVVLAGAALSLGASEAVAAFFVGMAVGATTYGEEIESRLAPLRDTFAVVFFFWIGLQTDPLALGPVAVPILLAVTVTLPTKLAAGYLGGRRYDLSPRRSLRVGLALVTRGEFSLIVAAAVLGGSAVLSPAVADRLYAFTVGYVLVLSVTGTVLMQATRSVETRLFGRGGTPVAD